MSEANPDNLTLEERVATFPEQPAKLLQAARAAWKASFDSNCTGSIPDARVAQKAIELTSLALGCMQSWSEQARE